MTNISGQSSFEGTLNPLQRYLYEPISDYGQIRLLRVQPKGACADLVICSLETVELPPVSDFSRHPMHGDHALRYRALSYMWGEKRQIETILINGRLFEVRSNLFKFLRVFQYGKRCADPIWIDQICINQANLRERSCQIQQMRDVYEAADEVIAWLGEESAQEAADIEISKRMAGSENEVSRDENILEPILNNPYFSRLWIVQELVLAKEIIVMNGDNEMAWDALILACSPHMLLCTEDDLDSRLTDSSSILDRLHAARVKEPDILSRLSAVNAFCGQKCADPRDKLYGLYGLLGRSNLGHTWISYDSPVLQVFQRFCHDVLNPLNVNDFEFETLSRLSWEMGLVKR
jgi:hypothetical protein